jgi:tetratricopeptide (TPR) repeat protein
MDRDEIVSRLPSYMELHEKIGDGGFASVYRVHNSKLQIDWAVKVIDIGKLTTGKEIEKILKEARLPAQIHHPNVVTVHDVDEEHGFVFMELVDGPLLSDIVSEGVNSWVEFRDLASGMIAGLAEAHRRGIVHGDLSPKNILLTPNKHPKLVDFGFAHRLDQSMSRVGVTPGYASPEHILMRPITPQSDVFSLGVILYRLATGNHPFGWDGKSLEGYSMAVITGDVLPPEILFPIPSGDVERLLQRALHRERGARYPTAVEMERAFQNASRREPRKEDLTTTSAFRRSSRHYQRGMTFYQGTTVQEMDWAEEEFNKALTEDPRLTLALVGLADVAIFRHMSCFDRSPVGLAKAEHYCHKTLEIDPSCAQAYRSLGRIYMTRREYAAAEDNLQKAIRLNPDYLAAHISLAWTFIEAHELDKAELAATSARVLAEDEFEVMMTFTRIYNDKKEYERSLASAQEAVSIHRMSGRGYHDLAMAQRAVGRFADARKSFRLSLEYHGDPNSRVDLGLTELLEGNFEEARSHFASATSETFGFLASYYLGLTEHHLDDHQAAETAFRQSLDASDLLSKTDPGNPLSRALGAMAAAGLGDARRSSALALMARELDPKDGMIAFYAACAATWFDTAEASERLKEALGLPYSPSQIEAEFNPHFRR